MVDGWTVISGPVRMKAGWFNVLLKEAMKTTPTTTTNPIGRDVGYVVPDEVVRGLRRIESYWRRRDKKARRRKPLRRGRNGQMH